MEPAFTTHRVPRTGAKDLVFEGVLLGRAERQAAPPDRPLRVSVYVTRAGAYVTHIERGALIFPGTDAAAPENQPSKHTAQVHDSAEAAFRTLVNRRGELGAVSKAAWESAYRHWPALRGQDVEEAP